MTVTTSIRVAVKQKLVELLAEQPQLSGVQVAYSQPLKYEADEVVFLGRTVGNVNVPTFRAGRKSRDDTFTITVHFETGRPGMTAEQADVRAEEMYGALENVLADDPTLGGLLHGAAAAWQADGEYELGPPVPLNEGFAGFADATITIKARLT